MHRPLMPRHAKKSGRPKGNTTQLTQAVAALEMLLRDGPRSIMELKVAMDRRKLGWRTVEKAEAKLNIIPQRERGLWFWRLPGV